MAISRPLLLALLGVVLLGVTAVAVQSTRNSATDTPTAASTQTPAAANSTASAQAAKPAALSPDAALRSALNVREIKSAHFEGSFSTTAKGAETAKLEAAGRFQSRGPNVMPKLDVQVSSSGLGSKLDVGFVSTGDKAYIVSDGTGYQLPEAAWSQAQQASAAQASANPAPAMLDIDPSKWVKATKTEGTEKLDGVETQHVSATVDTAAALRDLGSLAPGADLGAAAKNVKSAKLDVWVGSDDKLLRRIDVEFAAAGTTMRFQAQLSELNDPQTIDAPDKVSDTLPANILGGATGAFSSGLSLATGADPQTIELPTNNNPQRLAHAVKDHRKALIFFEQSRGEQARGLDDKATAEAVRAADRQTKALVLSDDVRNTKRYGKLVEDVGVTQAPAIVIVDRHGRAHLIEGYVDAETLVQELSDAR